MSGRKAFYYAEFTEYWTGEKEQGFCNKTFLHSTCKGFRLCIELNKSSNIFLRTQPEIWQYLLVCVVSPGNNRGGTHAPFDYHHFVSYFTVLSILSLLPITSAFLRIALVVHIKSRPSLCLIDPSSGMHFSWYLGHLAFVYCHPYIGPFSQCKKTFY